MFRYHVESFGCTMNHGEAELLKQRLFSEGNQLHDPNGSDVNFLFTCVVIGETEKRMIKRIRELSGTGVPLVVCGCLANTYTERVLEAAPHALLIAPADAAKLDTSVISTWLNTGISTILQGSTQSNEQPHITTSFSHDDIFSDPSFSLQDRVTSIVPISQGCLGNCAYCITRKARGTLQSYPVESIRSMVEKAVTMGAMEIQLTSQDTGIYGKDTGTSLPELLSELAGIPGDFMIRVGMMNPLALVSGTSELIQAFSSPRIFKFLHLPVQSGDNGILRAMKREYQVEDAERIVHDFRERFPDLTLSTDIITGFPGETKEAFQTSVDLLERLQPDLVNITRFSERPGTEAAHLPEKVHGRISKERSRILTDKRIRIGRERNSHFVGERMHVLATEKGKENSVISRDENYRLVVIKERIPLGEWYGVSIVDSTDVYLLGTIN